MSMKKIFSRFDQIPKDILINFTYNATRLAKFRRKLKNPINDKTGKYLKPGTIKNYECSLKEIRAELQKDRILIKYMKRHGLLKNPDISYPFIPDIFKIESIRDENSLHDQMLDNINELIKDLDKRTEHYKDDLLKMVNFIFEYHNSKWAPDLVYSIVNYFIWVLENIKDHLERSEESKVVNLKE